MNDDKSATGAAFDTAADKRAHDIERLSQMQQERVSEIKEAAEQKRSQVRAEQAERRDREIDEERAKILREHPKLVLEPKQDGSKPSRGPNKEAVERMAEHAVDRRYCLS